MSDLRQALEVANAALDSLATTLEAYADEPWWVDAHGVACAAWRATEDALGRRVNPDDTRDCDGYPGLAEDSPSLEVQATRRAFVNGRMVTCCGDPGDCSEFDCGDGQDARTACMRVVL